MSNCPCTLTLYPAVPNQVSCFQTVPLHLLFSTFHLANSHPYFKVRFHSHLFYESFPDHAGTSYDTIPSTFLSLLHGVLFCFYHFFWSLMHHILCCTVVCLTTCLTYKFSEFRDREFSFFSLLKQ